MGLEKEMKFKTEEHDGMRVLKVCLRHPEKKAKIWTGHVLDQKTKESIIAGWCSGRCSNNQGFCGWVKLKK